MTILFALLSAVLFLDCIVLILLILLQLPKKDAGAGGLAFGGSATDALFGAGSGNALTTITKYSAGIFFGVALLMCILTAHRGKTGGGAFVEELTKPSTSSAPFVPQMPPGTSSNINLIPMPSSTNPAPANSSTPAASSNSAAPPTAPPPAQAEKPGPATNK
jgi:protein translocase SecG subunit